jgi:hypothetical protein
MLNLLGCWTLISALPQINSSQLNSFVSGSASLCLSGARRWRARGVEVEKSCAEMSMSEIAC